MRDERFVDGEPAYRDATAELAIAGDPDARAEWREFVREGRVRMLDGFSREAGRALLADPESATDWIGHLDSNCCLGFQAFDALRSAFPTSPVDCPGPEGAAQNRVAFERWHAKHAGTFVWSRLLDGSVPGPRAR